MIIYLRRDFSQRMFADDDDHLLRNTAIAGGAAVTATGAFLGHKMAKHGWFGLNAQRRAGNTSAKWHAFWGNAKKTEVGQNIAATAQARLTNSNFKNLNAKQQTKLINQARNSGMVATFDGDFGKQVDAARTNRIKNANNNSGGWFSNLFGGGNKNKGNNNKPSSASTSPAVTNTTKPEVANKPTIEQQAANDTAYQQKLQQANNDTAQKAKEREEYMNSLPKPEITAKPPTPAGSSSIEQQAAGDTAYQQKLQQVKDDTAQKAAERTENMKNLATSPAVTATSKNSWDQPAPIPFS